MVTESDDMWSYGLSAKPEPEEIWPPPGGSDAGPSDPVRSTTGRWTSPSLGAYDPITAAAADTNGVDGMGPSASGATGLDPFTGRGVFEADQGGQADEGYFDRYGYGEDHGDGGLGPQYPDPGLDDELVDARYDPAYDADYDPDFDPDFDPDLDDEDHQTTGDARRNAIEWAVVLVGAVLLALILRAVLLQAFWIPSPSMESTLLVKDRVLVNKVSYRLHDINRGDVVVFRRTDVEIANNPELPRDVIKRVIGLAGETIQIEDNVVTIDGVTLLEPYLDEGVTTSDFGPEVVPEDHIFVMGDNRELSLDSRFETGPIAHDRVVGRAFFLFWPLDRLGSL